MPVIAESSATGYDVSLRLAPYSGATVTRTGETTATVHIDLEARHSGLAIRLLKIGYESAFVDSDTGDTGPADVYAVLLAYDTGEGVPALGAVTEFPVSLDALASVGHIGVVGLDPDSTDDSGAPISLVAMYASSGDDDSLAADDKSDSIDDSGEDDDEVLPTDVIVRKKRIPIPPGTGHASALTLPLVAAGAFLAGMAVGALL